MSEKKILLCVEPGERYVDSATQTWTFRERQINCGNCGKAGRKNYVYVNQDNGVVLCAACVTVTYTRHVFRRYETTEQLKEILERFSTTLINCEAEFKRHLPEKGESWLQDGTDVLYTNVLCVTAKLLLADGKEDQLDEAIDLILSAMMLAERYLRDADKDEDEIPF